jgi:cation diffusion facilitator family transporter
MPQHDRHRRIQRVLIITMVANLAVASAKIVVGLLSGSLAMIADGFHSSLDATSNVVGLISNALTARPPDDKHPYGYRRIETLASMIVGGILLLTGWEIVENSIQRLMSGGAPEVTPLSFAAMILTLVVNLVVAVYERRVGLRLNSEFLLADAEHTKSDIWVSLTVLASLAGVRLGWPWIDAVAALGVVALIVVIAWQIIRRAARILIDEAALDASQVSEIVEDVPGVRRVARVRSRGSSDDVHLDLEVEVEAPTTASHSDAISQEIRERLRGRFSGLADVQVRFRPLRNAPPDLALTVRAEADALGLSVHEIIPAMRGQRLDLEMHVEVPPEQSVGEAHAVVTQLEERIRKAIQGVDRVVTHIEPAPHREQRPPRDSYAQALIHDAFEIARALYPNNTWHDLDLRPEADGGYALSMHCHVAEDMPLEDAHQLAEAVETQLRVAIPALHRVTIHTEPPEPSE